MKFSLFRLVGTTSGVFYVVSRKLHQYLRPKRFSKVENMSVFFYSDAGLFQFLCVHINQQRCESKCSCLLLSTVLTQQSEISHVLAINPVPAVSGVEDLCGQASDLRANATAAASNGSVYQGVTNNLLSASDGTNTPHRFNNDYYLQN